MNTPEDEKNDPVWDLLNEARPAEPSAFFSRNVVREVRRLEAEGPVSKFGAIWAWFRQPLALGGAAVALVAVGAVALTLLNAPDQTSTAGGALVEVTPAPHSEAVENFDNGFDPASEIGNLDYLGELMAVTDPSMLDDNALADLFF